MRITFSSIRLVNCKTAMVAVVALCIILDPSSARADVGLPMIFLGFPFMLLAFVPVCLIEMLVFSRRMKVPFIKLGKPVVVANLVSTLVGYPLSWLLLLALELLTTRGKAFGLASLWSKVIAVVFQSAWLVPYENDLRWMVPAAGIVGLVPAFFLSIWIESKVLNRFSTPPTTFLPSDVRQANLQSYALLLLILFIYLGYEILRA
jgi:hypothetical protein